VTSGVPFTLGQWQHVVVVYDPVGGDPTNAMAIIYINGVAANTNINPGGVPGYAECTGDHDPSIAVNGQPAMSLGGYNNANGGTDGFENPWFGAADEYAWYPKALSPAQILAHYQNGTNALRGQSYPSLIQSDNPVAYLRLDEIAPNVDIANNLGDLRSNGIGANTPGVVHPATSALAGRTDDGASSYHQRNGSTTTDIPWQAESNPNAGVPFTFETWVRPTSDRQNPGAAPINNRYVSSGNRTGWVIFQRAPDISYTPSSGYSGVGWTFRMYDGLGSSGQDVLTGVDYQPGQWQHLVFTWEPQTENGDVGGNGNDQWQGVLTAYFNGVPVATNANALYSANVNPTEDATMPADFAVGSYNAASGLGSNPFEGDVDEVAFYPNIVLTTNQILAHYQAATTPNYGTNYEELVYAAGLFSTVNSSGQSQERVDLPSLYLRFNEPAFLAAANSGTLGHIADGSLVLTANSVAGPESPAYPGFGAANEALPLDGDTQFASLNNPDGLNISNEITLEAWVRPAGVAALSAGTNRIVSHGPQTISTYLGLGSDGPFVNAITNTTEVFLRIDGSGPNYSVGVGQYDDTTGTNVINQATVAVPAGDMGGSAWVHLVGTYDGANWNLYRNGVLVATQASATGALPVPANWAIGATGEGWADNFPGSVDEVAIYDKALFPASVAAHYQAALGAATPIELSIALVSPTSAQVSWTGSGSLQSTTAFLGTNTVWTTVGPANPATVTIGSGAMFFRVIAQ